MRCCPGVPGTNRANSTSTPPAPVSCWNCRPLPASTPKRSGHWRARWPMPRPSAARSRCSTGQAPGSAPRPMPGRRRAPAPAGRWRGWDSAGARCSRMAAGASSMRAAPPFTLSDYRVFVVACLAVGPGPAAETALGAFRRALEGTLASAGAHARRMEPDALLSLAAELIAPDMHGERDGATSRPARRWSPRDPLHEQCIAPGPGAHGSRRPGSPSTTRTARTSRCACSRRSPSPRSGRAGAAMR